MIEIYVGMAGSYRFAVGGVHTDTAFAVPVPAFAAPAVVVHTDTAFAVPVPAFAVPGIAAFPAPAVAVHTDATFPCPSAVSLGFALRIYNRQSLIFGGR